MFLKQKTRHAPQWVRDTERIVFCVLSISILLVPLSRSARAQSASDTSSTTDIIISTTTSSTSDSGATDTTPFTPDQPYIPTLPRTIMNIKSRVGVAICGNAIVDPGEVCDGGYANNDGAYSSSTAGRHCGPDCYSWGPYCGDGILEPYYGEECDDSDENGKNGFCSSDCKQLEKPISSTTPPVPPPTPSGNGGSDGVTPLRAQTQVTFAGKAYPYARVQILKDGDLNGIAAANGDGDFTYQVLNATPGPTTFGFWAEDAKKIRSITYTTTFQVTQNATTNVGNVFLPPTIRVTAKKFPPGKPITFDGTSVPKALVSVFEGKNRTALAQANAGGDGAWNVDADTTGLASEMFHQFTPMFALLGTTNEAQKKSGSGQLLNLYIGNNGVSTDGSIGDLNHDGKVNMTDFSMLLFRWGSSDSLGDLNRDGKVNIADLSIMLYHWTG